MIKSRKNLVLNIFFLAMLVFSFNVFSDVSDDAKLFEILMNRKDVNLKKEMEFLLDYMKNDYPNEKSKIAILEGKYLYSKNKKEEASKMFETVKPSDKHYIEMLKIYGEYSRKYRDFKGSKKAYSLYFNKLINSMSAPPKNKDKLNEIIEDSKKYISLLRQLKEYDTIKKFKISVTKIIGKQEASLVDKLELIRQRLDIAEARKSAGKSIKVEIEKVLNILKEFEWVGPTEIGLLAYSTPELARAYLLIGNYKKAINVLQSKRVKNIYIEIERSFKTKERISKESPRVLSELMLGRIFLAKAKSLSNKAEKKKYLLGYRKGKLTVKGAFGYFITALTRYKLSPYFKKGYQFLMEVKKVAVDQLGMSDEKIQKPIDKMVPPSIRQVGEADEAYGYIAAEKYGKAIGIFKKLMAGKRPSPETVKFGYWLTVCYVKQKKWKEAEKVADKLISKYTRVKTDKNYPELALLAIAITQNKLAQKDKTKASVYKKEAMRIFQKLVDKLPKSEKAANAAYQVAQYRYNLANKLQKSKSNDDRLKAAGEFKKALKNFQKVIVEYGGHPYATRSNFMAGLINYFLSKKVEGDKSNKHKEAAKIAFLRYYELEDSMKMNKKIDRQDALYRAAVQMVSLGQLDGEKGAVFFLKKVIKELNSSEFLKVSPKEKKRIQNLKSGADVLILWSTVISAKHFRVELRKYKALVKELPEKIKNKKGELIGNPERVKAEENKKNAEKNLKDSNLKTITKFEAWKNKHWNKNVSKMPEKMPGVLAHLGNLYMELEDNANADRNFSQLRKSYPNSKEAKDIVFSQGKAFLEVGKIAKAIAVFQEILNKLEKQSSGNLAYIMKKLLYKEKPDELTAESYKKANNIVAKIADEFIKRQKENKYKERYKIIKGRALINLAKYDEGEKVLNSIIELNEKSAYVLNVKTILADALIAQNKTKEAIKTLKELISLTQMIPQRTKEDRAKAASLKNGAFLKMAIISNGSDKKAVVSKGISYAYSVNIFADRTTPEGHRKVAYATALIIHMKSKLGLPIEKEKNEFSKEGFGKYRKYRLMIQNIPPKQF